MKNRDLSRYRILTDDGETLFVKAAVKTGQSRAPKVPVSTPPALGPDQLVVGVPVKELARARAFYEMVLGLRPTRVLADKVTYEIGLTLEQEAVVAGSGVTLWFHLKDLSGALTRLQAEGCKVKVQASAGGRIAHSSDPDGNRIELVETAAIGNESEAQLKIGL
jgi:predicted enzyme related to lactoylglutathione lyase